MNVDFFDDFDTTKLMLDEDENGWKWVNKEIFFMLNK